MDDDTIIDLKQFIAGTVAQEVSSISQDLRSMGQQLNRRIDNLERSVADSLEAGNGAVDAHYEQRIARLEQKTTA